MLSQCEQSAFIVVVLVFYLISLYQPGETCLSGTNSTSSWHLNGGTSNHIKSTSTDGCVCVGDATEEEDEVNHLTMASLRVGSCIKSTKKTDRQDNMLLPIVQCLVEERVATQMHGFPYRPNIQPHAICNNMSVFSHVINIQ